MGPCPSLLMAGLAVGSGDIYDVRASIQTIRSSLRPGGVLLATFPGISQISRYDMDRWRDYWRFTLASAHTLFGEFWPPGYFIIEAFGNMLVAIAYLQGLASSTCGLTN